MVKDKTQPEWLSLDEMLKLADSIEDWSYTYGWLNYGLNAGIGQVYVGVLEFEPIGNLAIVIGLNEKIKLVGTKMVEGCLREVTKKENYGAIRAQSLNIVDGRTHLGKYSDKGIFNEKSQRFVPDRRLIELYERVGKSCEDAGQKTYYDSEKFASEVIGRIRDNNERYILERARSLIK